MHELVDRWLGCDGDPDCGDYRVDTSEAALPSPNPRGPLDCAVEDAARDEMRALREVGPVKHQCKANTFLLQEFTATSSWPSGVFGRCLICNRWVRVEGLIQ